MDIAVLTSSRADYGFYKPLLENSNKGNVNFKLIVFGTHLSKAHGYTVEAIEKDQIEIFAKVDTIADGDTPAAIAKSMGKIHSLFSEVWDENNFDAILCLGDRYEMYAAVSSSVPFNIPVIHLSGGEETLGAIDNYFRHALTLMAKHHFTNTKLNADRVVELKGSDENVYHTGSLAIDNILATTLYTETEFKEEYSFDVFNEFLLFTFHPETVKFELNEAYVEEIAKFISKTNFNILCTMPNVDTYGSVIRKRLISLQKENDNLFLYESLGSKGYYSALKYCYAVVGNSSSGIVESSSFKKYVINVGDRQKGRERGRNVLDCRIDAQEIERKVEEIKTLDQLDNTNIYGDGKSSSRMINILKELV